MEKMHRDRLQKYIRISDGKINLEIGREYTVYGIVFWDNSPWFYICDEESCEYPTPKASEFFRIVDNRMSAHWRLSTRTLYDNKIESSLLFPEWANENPFFYENLIDGNKETERIFDYYRKKMDSEFPTDHG